MELDTKLKTLGKYKLIASIAEGGMAKVFLGLMAGPAGFNKLLVIKVLNPIDSQVGGDEGVTLFWDEARLAARLIHPNIVHTYEVGEADGHYFLAMEYLDGQSYRTVHHRLGKGLPLCEELRILHEVARGLHYAHELRDFNGEPLGVVHRDVSPQNVLVTYDGQVKLIDFGIAKSHDAGHKTKVGVIKGKLDYIAPEQLSGESVDARADIFALGVMLWEVLTGERFSGGRKVTEVSRIHARLTAGERKLRELVPDVPDALAHIVDRAIALNPSDRFASAGDFADALDAYIEATGSRPSARSLSEMMNVHFAEERSRMRSLIDHQIEASRNLADSTTLPHLGLDSTLTPSSIAHDPSLARTHSPPPRGRGVLGATMVGVVLALAGFAWFVSQRDMEPRASAAGPASSSVPEPPPQASPTVRDRPAAEPLEVAASTISLRVRAEPEGARVTLDGAELPMPFEGHFRRGTDLHHLEVSARGFQSQKQLVDFSRDREVIVRLEPASHSSRRRVSAARVESEPAPTPAPPAPVAEPEAPPPEKKVFSPGSEIEVGARVPMDIDTTNPYKQR